MNDASGVGVSTRRGRALSHVLSRSFYSVRRLSRVCWSYLLKILSGSRTGTWSGIQTVTAWPERNPPPTLVSEPQLLVFSVQVRCCRLHVSWRQPWPSLYRTPRKPSRRFYCSPPDSGALLYLPILYRCIASKNRFLNQLYRFIARKICLYRQKCRFIAQN